MTATTIRSAICGLFAVFLVGFPSTLHAIVMVFTENPWREMNIYPREAIAAKDRTITVDGDLADWNPQAFYHLYNVEETKNEFSFRVAFAYDADALWIAARFTDRNPLRNQTHPATSPKNAWDGDSLQIRLTEKAQPVLNDPDKNVALLTLWQFTHEKLPALHIGYGMRMAEDAVFTGKDSELVFREIEGGYVIEGRIPYDRLRQRPPQPGARWWFQVQGNFSDADGKAVHVVYDCFTKTVSFFRDPTGWGAATFVKPADVTARLEAKLAEETRKHRRSTGIGVAIPFAYQNPAAGFVSLAVRDDAGRIVRTLRMKSSQAAGAVTDAWDGLDDHGAPVAAGKYTLTGLSQPGIQSRFVASVHNSGTPPWQGVDSASQWGGDHAPAVDVATDADGNAYLAWDTAEKGHDLIKVHRDGRKLWGVNSPWRDQVVAVAYAAGRVYLAYSGGPGSVAVYDAATGNRLLFANGQSTLTVGGDVAGLMDLVVVEGKLFAALRAANEIRVFALDTLALEKTLPVPEPRALAWNAKARALHGISGNHLVVIEDPRVRTLAADLDHPRGLAVDGDGVSWVALRGKSQQVVGFDAAGKRIGAVGKPGGRAWVGAYDPSGMLQPAGIALDGAGRLWVAEEDLMPSRQSLWNVKNGKLVREFFGGGKYSPMMAPDPTEPGNVFIHNTRFVVDYETGKVTPAATVYRKDHVTNALLGTEYRYAFMGQTFEIATYQGRKFAYDGHGGVYAYGDNQFKPLSHVGQAFRGLPGMTREKCRREIGPNASAVWRDKNGDGRFSDDEVRMIEGMSLLPNIAQFGGTFFPGAKFILGRKIFAPQRLDDHGAPVYPEPEDAPPILTGDGPMRDVKNWVDVLPSLRDDWRSFYAIASVGGGPTKGDGKTEGIYKFNQAGDILWRYAPVAVGFGLSKNLSKPGELFGALRIAGEIELPAENGGEIVGIGCYRGVFGFLTEDGLFVDQFGTDVGYGPNPDFNTLFIENFNGYFFRHAKNGKVYLFTGATDGRIIELSGWEKIRRLAPVKVEVTAEQHAAVVHALAAAKRGTEAMIQLTVAPRAKGWGAPAEMDLGNDRFAQVSLAYDAGHLYARFVVEDPTPWRNAAKDWRYDFKGGDSVDLQLGANRPAKQKAGHGFLPGDVRIWIAPDSNPDGFHAVALWKRVAEGMAKESFTYHSPVAQETFERVELLKDARVTVAKTAAGYTVEATIPWPA
ncbi:MAG: hypothetical protein IT578_09725, partial [Verrucomicrobiae bacterium]|nr:hypothetical protein [Verrucomicrobiae bacterium]